jgi:hypothetical protein
MNIKIWTPLQIAWLVLAMFTVNNSMSALNSDDRYCSGMVCQRDNDCGAPCVCDLSNSICNELDQSER